MDKANHDQSFIDYILMTTLSSLPHHIHIQYIRTDIYCRFIFFIFALLIKIALYLHY